MSETEALIRKVIAEARQGSEKTVDGVPRDDDLEEKINAACRAALNTPAGNMLMDYLKSITTNAVLPASASDAELRMMEGMRRVVAILDTRRNTNPK